MWDPYAEFESAVLPNGLTVYAATWPGRTWEAMGFLIHSGAEHDPVGLEGTAHFVEHCVSQNTIVPSEEITAFFENSGGDVELGSTGYPSVKYKFFVPIDKAVLSKAFSIFGHMLLSSRIEKLIEREREVIVGEFHRRFSPRLKFDLSIRENKALYSGYWLERFASPMGSPESIGKITKSNLQDCYDKHYTPANMSVVAVGGMSLTEIVEFLEKSPFAISKTGTRTPEPKPLGSFGFPAETRYVFEMSKNVKTEVPEEVCWYRSVAKIPGTLSETVLRTFGDMLYKSLFEEIRGRRAWSYATGYGYCNHRHFHEFTVACDAISLKAIGEIEKVVDSCIASMAYRADLLETAKQHRIAKNLMADLRGRDVRNVSLSDLSDNRCIISLGECNKDVESVTMADVRDLLNWLKPERRWTLLTTP